MEKPVAHQKKWHSVAANDLTRVVGMSRFAFIDRFKDEFESIGACAAFYASCQSAALQTARLDRFLLKQAHPQYHALAKLDHVVGAGTRNALKGFEDWFAPRSSDYAAADSVASLFSPAAYLAELYSVARTLHPDSSPYYIDNRRPDLARLVVSQETMNAEVTSLSLSNEIIEEAMLGGAGEDANYQPLSTMRHPFSTPFHRPLETIREAAAQSGDDLGEIAKRVGRTLTARSEILLTGGFSPELYDLLQETMDDVGNDGDYISDNFGLENIGEWRQADNLLPSCSISESELSEYLGQHPFQRTRFINSEARIDLTVLPNEYPSAAGYYLYKNPPEKVLELFEGKICLGDDTLNNLGGDFGIGCLISPREHLERRVVFWISEEENYISAKIKLSKQLSGTNTDLIEEKKISKVNISKKEHYFLVLYHKNDSYVIEFEFMREDGTSTATSINLTFNDRNPLGRVKDTIMLNKAVRLRNQTGLEFHEQAWLLKAAAHDSYSEQGLIMLSVWPRHRARYGVDFDTFTASLSLLNPYFRDGAKSQVEKVFNDPPLADRPLYLTGEEFCFTQGDETSAHTCEALRVALGFTAYELGLACRLTDPDGASDPNTTRKLTHELASHLFRMAQLARSHDLSFVELYGLLDALEVDGARSRLSYEVGAVDWLANYDHVWALRQWMDEDRLTPVQLLALAQWQPVTPATPEHFAFVQQLHETVPPADAGDADGKRIQLDLAAASVASSFGLAATTARALLDWIECGDGGGFHLHDFFNEIDAWFTGGGNADSYAELPASIVSTCNLIAQMAGLTQHFHLSAADLVQFDRHEAIVFGAIGLYLEAQPLDVVRAIGEYKRWLGRSALSESETLELFRIDDQDARLAHLAAIIGCDVEQVKQACDAINEPDAPATPVPQDVPTALRLESWVREAEALGVTVATLDKTLSLQDWVDQASPGEAAIWERWRDCEAGFARSDKTFKDALDEKKSPVLADYYLHGHIRSDDALTHLRTRDDLYRHFLLDTQVTSAVTTAPIAEAIASLQLYIDRCLQNLEPDAEPNALKAPFLSDWTNYNRRYATWAGLQKLLYYPENYIEPQLRYNRTQLQQQLEQDIQQGRISEGAVTDAYLRYLTAFEDIANLEIISGFQTAASADQSEFYFVGRTRSQPRRYFWRKLDNRVRGTQGEVLPTAWTEWLEIKAPGLDDKTLYDPNADPERGEYGWPECGEVQVMFYDGRLRLAFITYEERTESETTSAFYYINLAYLCFDDKWSIAKRIATSSIEGNLASGNVSPGAFFFSYSKERELAGIGLYRSEGDNEESDYGILYYDIYNQDTRIKEIGQKSKFPNSTNGRVINKYIEISGFKIEIDNIIVHEHDSVSNLYQDEFIKTVFLSDNGGSLSVRDYVYFSFLYDDKYSIIDGFSRELSLTSHQPSDGIIGSIKEKARPSWIAPMGDFYVIFQKQLKENLFNISPSSGDRYSIIDQIIPDDQDWIDENGEYIVRYEYDVELLGVSDVDFSSISSSHGVQFIDIGADSAVGLENGVSEIVRLNTLFGSELASRAYRGVDDVLNWSVQILGLEPSVDSGDPEPMDFNGAYGLYFWELFFYTPFLVASRLMEEQRYDEAERWLTFIFDPRSRQNIGNGSAIVPRYWNVVPLQEDTAWTEQVLDTTDPDEIALADPIHYKVNTYFRTLDLLIERGDHCYRQLERDTLVEAKMWYMTAQQLLGERPHVSQTGHWADPALGDLVNALDDAVLDAVSIEDARKALADLQDVLGPSEEVPDGETVKSLRTLARPFLPPFNDKLDGYWETLESRIFNLRHNLSIDGKALHLPLYADPIDPAVLHASVAAGTASDLSSPAGGTAGRYRFATMVTIARNAIGQLTQFGATLQSILDRQDAEALANLQAGQAADIAAQMVAIQKSTLEGLEKTIALYDETRTTAQQRYDFYADLYEKNISDDEQKALDLRNEAVALVASTSGLQMAGASADMAPNIFGLSNGGMNYGAPFYASAYGTEAGGRVKDANASIAEISENYRRRREEWKIQRDQALQNVAELDLQIELARIQLQAGQRQLRQAEMDQANNLAVQTFMQTKFTNQQLYQWMKGRLAAIYYQYYDHTVHLCRQTLASYNFEIPKQETLSFAGWNDLYQGLLAGETLASEMAKLERGYLDWTEREKQVTRTVSLSQVYAGLGNDAFDLSEKVSALLSGDETGQPGNDNDNLSLADDILTAQIKIETLGVDNDYPSALALGDLKLIKQISVTLPALLGPYQDIKAVLSYESANGATVAKGCDAIAISQGINDSGQFQLDFNDPSYLPFEGIAITDDGFLKLRFPNATGAQKDLLDTLSDMILHIRYTIRPSE